MKQVYIQTDVKDFKHSLTLGGKLFLDLLQTPK